MPAAGVAFSIHNQMATQEHCVLDICYPPKRLGDGYCPLLHMEQSTRGNAPSHTSPDISNEELHHYALDQPRTQK